MAIVSSLGHFFAHDKIYDIGKFMLHLLELIYELLEERSLCALCMHCQPALLTDIATFMHLL